MSQGNLINLNQKKVAIIGAGIAGLSTAYNLQQLNIEVELYEKAPQLNDNGLGFLIMSNGMEMFEKMGLDSIVRKEGNVINNFVSIDRFSNKLKETHINNCLAINRSRCIHAVYNQLDKDAVIFGKELINYKNGTNGSAKELSFADGSTLKADIVIGADGINSRFRNQLFPNHPKREIPEKEVVGVAKHPELVKKLGNTFYKVVDLERGINMGLLPSTDDEVIWFIQFNETKIPIPENTPVDLEIFSRTIASHFPTEFQEIIDASDFTKAFLWRMYDVDLLPSFHKNGIVLVGDSAHPLLSFTSQGVNSALEDAYLLAKILNENPNEKVSALYDQFNDIRRPIIQEAIEEGRLILDQFLHPEKYSNFKVPFVEYGSK
jgi:2-polyprenyl-6-methoxyphenol hydroxylase-like FAD-dependent oxidoreductase